MIEYDGNNDLNFKFKSSQKNIKSLKIRPTDNELLLLYGLFKQSTIGDNNTSKPLALWIKETYKWEAWNKQKGKTQDIAKKEYIKTVELLLNKYNS